MGKISLNWPVCSGEKSVADPFLNWKPMKLIIRVTGPVSLHFITALAAAFCSACRCLICFWGSPNRRPWQQSSFNKIRQTAVLPAALQVMYEKIYSKIRCGENKIWQKLRYAVPRKAECPKLLQECRLSGWVGRHEYSSESLAKKQQFMQNLSMSPASCLEYREKEKSTEHWSL